MNFVQPIRDLNKIEEMKKVLLKSSYRNYFLFELGINIGVRISDLLPLRVMDIRGLDNITIKEHNTQKLKIFKVNNDLKHEIMQYTDGMKDDDFLFPSQKGDHLGRIRAFEIIRQAGKKVGLTNIGANTLRKTFGYHFYKKYRDVSLLQNIYGHPSPSVTLKYIGISQDEINEVLKNEALKNFKL